MNQLIHNTFMSKAGRNFCVKKNKQVIWRCNVADTRHQPLRGCHVSVNLSINHILFDESSRWNQNILRDIDFETFNQCGKNLSSRTVWLLFSFTACLVILISKMLEVKKNHFYWREKTALSVLSFFIHYSLLGRKDILALIISQRALALSSHHPFNIWNHIL